MRSLLGRSSLLVLECERTLKIRDLSRKTCPNRTSRSGIFPSVMCRFPGTRPKARRGIPPRRPQAGTAACALCKKLMQSKAFLLSGHFFAILVNGRHPKDHIRHFCLPVRVPTPKARFSSLDQNINMRYVPKCASLRFGGATIRDGQPIRWKMHGKRQRQRQLSGSSCGLTYSPLPEYEIME